MIAHEKCAGRGEIAPMTDKGFIQDLRKDQISKGVSWFACAGIADGLHPACENWSLNASPGRPQTVSLLVRRGDCRLTGDQLPSRAPLCPNVRVRPHDQLAGAGPLFGIIESYPMTTVTSGFSPTKVMRLWKSR